MPGRKVMKKKKCRANCDEAPAHDYNDPDTTPASASIEADSDPAGDEGRTSVRFAPRSTGNGDGPDDGARSAAVARTAMSFKSRRFVNENEGGIHKLTVRKRERGETTPMDRRSRRKTKLLRRFHMVSFRDRGTSKQGGGSHRGGFLHRDGGSNTEGADKAEEEVPAQQHTHYTLMSNYTRKSQVDRFVYLDKLGQVFRGSDKPLVEFLHWSFRISFLGLFLSQLTIFMAMVIIFAGFIALAGKLQPSCIQGGDYVNSAFTDAFALSWTTFSTVGYGHTYPSLGLEYSAEGLRPGQCAFIGFISSVESFVGVLYAGFCGAIIFGKVLRIHSEAEVTFSEAITVRYGDGVELYDEEDEADHIERSAVCSGSSTQSRIPCPVLEFRIVNNHFGLEGGEIIDASLNVLASFWEHMALIPTKQRSHSLREDHDRYSSTVPKRRSRPVQLEVREHPCFKWTWYARHVMDEDSPLLTPAARKRVRMNNGYWPREYNSPAGVRSSIMFDEITVNLSGVSNLSTASVYAQKTYGLVDVVVGYQFSRCMYRGEDGAVKVDMDVINDVFEQFGGGGEPLLNED